MWRALRLKSQPLLESSPLAKSLRCGLRHTRAFGLLPAGAREHYGLMGASPFSNPAACVRIKGDHRLFVTLWIVLTYKLERRRHPTAGQARLSAAIIAQFWENRASGV